MHQGRRREATPRPWRHFRYGGIADLLHLARGKRGIGDMITKKPTRVFRSNGPLPTSLLSVVAQRCAQVVRLGRRPAHACLVAPVVAPRIRAYVLRPPRTQRLTLSGTAACTARRGAIGTEVSAARTDKDVGKPPSVEASPSNGWISIARSWTESADRTKPSDATAEHGRGFVRTPTGGSGAQQMR